MTLRTDIFLYTEKLSYLLQHTASKLIYIQEDFLRERSLSSRGCQWIVGSMSFRNMYDSELILNGLQWKSFRDDGHR